MKKLNDLPTREQIYDLLSIILESPNEGIWEKEDIKCPSFADDHENVNRMCLIDAQERFSK